MSENSIKDVLKDFGLTQKEIEIYIFLAKHGPIKGGDVIKRTKTHRALVYRMLTSLQKKGLVESTLEAPARFQAIPFENILDQNIKMRREEAAKIENKKAELLDYWKKIKQTESEPFPEKFTILEGKNRINSKIFQLIKETKCQLSMIMSPPEFMRNVELGFPDGNLEQVDSKVQYRLLTDLSDQNLQATKALLKNVDCAKARFEVRMGLELPPRMLIRDEEEAMFFLSANQGKSSPEDNQTCLCTNSKALVQSFKGIFEGLWRNATDLKKKKTSEIGFGKIESLTTQIADLESSLKKYKESMSTAKESILMLTSTDGLMDFSSNIEQLKEWSSKGINVKVMAPITADNFKKAQELTQFCEIRHIPNSFSRSLVLVDGKRLFQLHRPIQVKKKTTADSLIGFTDNVEFAKKTETLLKELWKNAIVPSTVNMEFIRKEASADFPKRLGGVTTPLCRVDGYKIIDEQVPTEKDIVNRIISATKNTPTVSSKEFKAYCTMGQAVIHPPRAFKLPDLLLFAMHFEKQSTLGEEDALIISMWLKTPKGFSYVPTAIIQNNPTATPSWKKLYDKSPAGKNVQFAKSDDLEIRLHGNTFFAGWNKPIPLSPSNYILPAGCIILETYGQLLTQSYTLFAPSGFKSKIEGNGFQAFVTFLSSKANYNGPGTDGYVTRDGIMTTTPPNPTSANS